MPLELQIIRASEFIRMGAQGHFDLRASKAALADLARACQKRGLGRAMIDLRDLQYGPKPLYSPRDLAELVSSFHESGFTSKERLAVLYRIDPYHRARMFAFLSTMHGFTVRAFSDFEKALLWLSAGTDTHAWSARSALEKAIPIRKRKTNDAETSIALRDGKKHHTKPRAN